MYLCAPRLLGAEASTLRAEADSCCLDECRRVVVLFGRESFDIYLSSPAPWGWFTVTGSAPSASAVVLSVFSPRLSHALFTSPPSHHNPIPHFFSNNAAVSAVRLPNLKWNLATVDVKLNLDCHFKVHCVKYKRSHQNNTVHFSVVEK